MIVVVCMFLDAGSSRDERSPQCSDADGGGGGRDNFGHVEEIHCLCQNVSVLPYLLCKLKKKKNRCV